MIASCTSQSTPGSDTKDYTKDCGCAYVKYTTDSTGQNRAGLATCKTCATSIGGCETDSGTYAEVWEFSCSGTIQGSGCASITCGSGTSHVNASKYKYVSAGCGSN